MMVLMSFGRRARRRSQSDVGEDAPTRKRLLTFTLTLSVKPPGNKPALHMHIA
jgi:hypothetical protein